MDNAQIVLGKPWKVLQAGDPHPYYIAGKKYVSKTTDISIVTTDGEEVVGSSEWMLVDPKTFDHIVALHNAWLENQ